MSVMIPRSKPVALNYVGLLYYPIKIKPSGKKSVPLAFPPRPEGGSVERSHPGIVSFWGETGAVHLQDSEQVRDDTMVGVVRVSLARQPVLGADLQMGIERKPLVGVSDQAHDEPRRPRPHTAPILGSLSRSCKEFPGIDYLGGLQLLGTCRLLPVTRKLAPAASAHSRKRLSGSSGDAATVWAGAARILTERSRARKRTISVRANFRRGYKSTCSYSLRIGSDTHSWTFSFNPKRDDQGLKPLFVDVGRNQDIGITRRIIWSGA